MSHNHPTDLLPALALGCLDTEERELVEQHLAGCKQCQTEISSYQGVVDNLSYGTPKAVPSSNLKNRLLKRIQKKPTSFAWFEKLIGRWPRFVPIASMASLVLFISLGISTFILINNYTQPQQRQSFENMRLVVLRGTANAPEAIGTLIIGPETRQGLFVVYSLPSLASTSQYQLWLVKGAHRTNGGIFSVSPRGQARLTVSAPRSLYTFDAFGVTIEPYGGSPGPTGKKVLGGKSNL